MQTELFHLHALSALHVGVGQAIGTVDLPIARAKATNLPQVPGSALKGVLRDHFERLDAASAKRLFGPDRISSGDDAHAGAVAFGDAHLLLFPVRSYAGVMAWATCPFVLHRYAADRVRGGCGDAPAVPDVRAGQAMIVDKSELAFSDRKLAFDDLDLVAAAAPVDGKLLEGAKALKDLDLVAAAAPVDVWADVLGKVLFSSDERARDHFKRHFAVLSDEDFAFLADTATEVRARIRINDETGVVQRGALWYEENLPGDSVLWGVLGMGPSRMPKENRGEDEVRKDFRAGLGDEAVIQIGGKATVGRGLVRFLAGERA